MPRAFSSKELAGNVLAAGKLAALAQEFRICLRRSQYCLPWTCAGNTLPCPAGSLDCRLLTRPGCPVRSGCVGASRNPLGAYRFDPDTYVRQLDELKGDLRAALADLEAHEKDVAGPVRTAARLSLDDLETGLKDLLRQVQDQKRGRRDAPAEEAP